MADFGHGPKNRTSVEVNVKWERQAWLLAAGSDFTETFFDLTSE